MGAFCRIGSLPGDEGVASEGVAVKVVDHDRRRGARPPVPRGELLRRHRGPRRRAGARDPVHPRWLGGGSRQRATSSAALGAEGMLVGLHGHTHRRFTDLTAEEIDDELTLRGSGAAVGSGSSPSGRCSAFPTWRGTPTRSCSRAWPCAAGGTSTATRSRTTGRTSCASSRSGSPTTRSTTWSTAAPPAPTARSCSSTAGPTRHRKRSGSSSTMHARRATRSSP